MEKKKCSGTGQRAIYKPGRVHPHCPVCDADLSVQGKHQKVVRGIVGRHFVTEGVSTS